MWQLFNFEGDNKLVLSLGVPVTADSAVSYIVSLVLFLLAGYCRLNFEAGPEGC